MCGKKVKDLSAHLHSEAGDHLQVVLQHMDSMRKEMADLKAQHENLQQQLASRSAP